MNIVLQRIIFCLLLVVTGIITFNSDIISERSKMAKEQRQAMIVHVYR